jgi:PIN domain nuclease of toxin-antitoxin system
MALGNKRRSPSPSRSTAWQMGGTANCSGNVKRRRRVSNFAIDSSALLAMIGNGPGAEVVAAMLPDAVVSTVSIAEAAAKLTARNFSTAPLEQALADSRVEIAPFSELQARLCEEMRRAAKSRGLSLGDRACLALALDRGLTAITADAAWVGATAAPVKLFCSAEA